MSEDLGVNFDGVSDSSTADEKLAFFSENWPKIELLIEQTQKTKVLVDKLDSYIDSVKDEVKSIRRIRFWVTLFSVVIILALICSLGYFLFCNNDFLTKNSSYTGTAFVVASISASVLLLVGLIRGSFRAIRERNKDEELPPHLLQVIEVMAKNFGDGS